MIVKIYVGVALLFLILIILGIVRIVVVNRRANNLKDKLNGAIEEDEESTTSDGTTPT